MDSRSPKILKDKSQFYLCLVCVFCCGSAYGEQLINQNVDIPIDSTLSHSLGTIQQLTGGPYTINNQGTIEATDVSSNGHTIQLKVGTAINNTGLIDGDGNENTNAIYFLNNTGTNNITNSGTIHTQTTGHYGQAIHIQDSSVSSINNLIDGTINVSDSSFSSSSIRVHTTGVVDSILNEGIISSSGALHVHGIVSVDTGYINEIINVGTISAQDGSESSRGVTFWGSGTLVNNSGTILGLTTGNNGQGIRVGDEGALDTLINSGTITGSRHGIANTGMINHLINTGTITGTSGYDIYNAGGVITHLTNAQSELTIHGDLPTNYLILTESISSYGKVAFTNATGTINFAVTEDAILTQGTYDAVLTGVSADNIGAHSGTHISDETHYTYRLNSASDSQWDLVVNDLTSPTQCSINSNAAHCAKTQCASSTIKQGLNALNSVNFAHLNTYDCDTFGPSGQCVSLGGRHVSINDPESDMYGLVFTYGKKQSDHFRWGGFIDTNLSHKTSSYLSLSEKIPMLGLYAVWNKNSDTSGLQIRVGNAYQSTDARITRPVVGVSEEGVGNTTITANMFALEMKNNFLLTDALTLSPFIATRYSRLHQNSYTERGVDLPLSFNRIIDRSWTAIGGLKFHKQINDTNSIYGTLGLEYDLSHSVSDLSPQGVSGITTTNLDENHQSIRSVMALGFDHQVAHDQMLRFKVQYQELPYQDMNETNIYASYNFSF